MSADVRSIAAVIDWRADFISYSESLAEAMAGVDLEIRRAYDWLEEQLALWKRAVRACEEDVVRALRGGDPALQRPRRQTFGQARDLHLDLG